MGAMEKVEYILERFNIAENAKFPIILKGLLRGDFDSMLAGFDFCEGAEIGVLDGEHAVSMFEHNPMLKLHLIDPYTPYDNGPRRDWNKHQMRAKQNLDPFSNRAIRYFEKSLDVVDLIPDERLDFVYIDGDHGFNFVIQDIIRWAAKVKKGGIVSGHDYVNKCPGVIKAVNAYTNAWDIKYWFLLDKGSHHPDSCPSWFWIKE